MKHIVTFFIAVGIVALLAGGAFFYYNLRGIGPAISPPVADITKYIPSSPETAKNTTSLPLAVPDGVSVSIFAKDLGDARVMTFDPRKNLLVSIPDKGKVLALLDLNKDGTAETVKTVISGLNQPHGITFYKNKLYIAQTNEVDTFDYDYGSLTASHKKKLVDLPGGGNHSSRTVAFGPDGRMYISVGSSCNVCVEKDWRRAKILVANEDGSGLAAYASGLRNAVFFTWDSAGKLWATDMGRDLIGDDLPPDTINKISEGADYGWPYCYGKQIQDLSFDNSGKAGKYCDTTEPSTIDYQAHSAPLGLAFVPDSWPAQFRRSLLVAMHGSWNRTSPTGYKIVRFSFDKNGKYTGATDFISGWLTPKGALGRPVDMIFDDSGNLYVSDDKAGVIYLVSIAK